MTNKKMKKNKNNKKATSVGDNNNQSSSSNVSKRTALHQESLLLRNNRHTTDFTDHNYVDNENDDNDDDNMNNYWDTIIDYIISYFAILGDSSISLLISFVLLLLSIIVSWYMTYSNNNYSYYINHNHNVISNRSSTYHHHSNNHRKHYNDADNFHQKDSMKKTIVNNHEIDITNNDNNNNNNYNDIDLGPIPKIDPPYIFIVEDEKTSVIPTAEMIIAYEKDGVIAIRGLLSNVLLKQLDLESSTLIHDEQMKRNKKSKKSNTQFYTVRHNVLFHNHLDSKTNNESSLSSFAKLALHSLVSSYAASFLHLHNHKNNTSSSLSLNQSLLESNNSNNKEEEYETLRVIRDIFLAKDSDDKYTCGWHVDDMGFWPATPNSPDGINAWIAFDDMPLNNSSGFALAVQSHNAIWKHNAYYATGASMIFPDSGYHNVSDMFQQRTGGGTCNIQHIAPHIHQRMEDTKRIYNIKRGDVIFHTRWLFHKTIPYPNSVNDDNKNRIYRRYSIRYGPGSSTIIPPGYGTEYSVLYNPKNGGSSADKVCYNDNIPWYPIAWTSSSNNNNHIDEEYTNRIKQEFYNIVNNQFPIVEKLANDRRNEMKPYLQRLAQQQQQKQKS